MQDDLEAAEKAADALLGTGYKGGYKAAKDELRNRLKAMMDELMKNPTMRPEIVRDFYMMEVQEWLKE